MGIRNSRIFPMAISTFIGILFGIFSRYWNFFHPQFILVHANPYCLSVYSLPSHLKADQIMAYPPRIYVGKKTTKISILRSPTRWCPSSLAKLVYKSNFTMVYGTYSITIVTGVYKTTYNWGGTTLYHIP